MGRGMRFHRGGVMGADQGLTRLFYDGGCGFCRGAVRFVARRDPSGRIHFAPLGGATFARLVPPEKRDGLPDSLLVLTPEGVLSTRSGAVIQLLRRMGPGWRWVGALLTAVPEPIRDAAYQWVARHRTTRAACPRDESTGDDRFEP